ncbi:MAG: hypothetical protein DI587_03545 [Variovorax paradoxus]|nr:MAG: hypothetical protein DI583_03545 [Variovorax paradoxus]PZQ15154.1 MAG: hypothetical protein DI587_03545 [Variovorax paradoxus]HVR52861.1 FlhC family transcriptional regulator [Pseudorhodoferax sp.]
MPANSRVDLRMRALSLARDCAALGARVRTLQHLTGLHPRELRYLLFNAQQHPPRGRAPDTREWYHSANLLQRMQASVVVSTFVRLRSLDFAPEQALVTAYRHYQTLYGDAGRISFDRAFDLVAHTAGLWITSVPSFDLRACAHCASDYLDAVGVHQGHDGACPFCRMIERHRRDPRLTASFRAATLPMEHAPDWLRWAVVPAGQPGAAADLGADGDTPLNAHGFPGADG